MWISPCATQIGSAGWVDEIILQNIPNFCFNNRHLDESKVSCDDNTSNVIHKICH